MTSVLCHLDNIKQMNQRSDDGLGKYIKVFFPSGDFSDTGSCLIIFVSVGENKGRHSFVL